MIKTTSAILGLLLALLAGDAWGQNNRPGDGERNRPHTALREDLPSCTACRQPGGVGQKFCTDCGGKMALPAPAPKFCTSCGGGFKGREQFCTGCGTRRSGKIRSHDPEQLFGAALRHIREGEFLKAEELLNQVIQVDPTRGSAWSNRGYVRYRRHNFDGAIRDFSKALDLNSSPVQMLVYRGTALAQIGRFREARADLQEAVRRKPELRQQLEPVLRKIETRLD